jgi:hypothetical protein
MTLVAPGQSPAYLALAMLNLEIYDPAKVNIVILPMSSLKLKKNSRNFRLNREMRAKIVVYNPFSDEF